MYNLYVYPETIYLPLSVENACFFINRKLRAEINPSLALFIIIHSNFIFNTLDAKVRSAIKLSSFI